MSDFYTEQLVKRKTPAKDIALKGILILVTVFAFMLVFFIPIAIIAPVIMICLDVFLFRNMDLEYEYLFVNGNLDIDKIMAKSKRKRAFEMTVNDLEVLAPSGAPELRQYQSLKAQNYGSCTAEAETYEMIVTQNGSKKRIIFEPNSVIVDGFRMLAPRKVFVQR